ncbi:MAG TPA: sulfate ABC transporter permease subunit CysT [Lachnospiraceae bacterium]|jgi:sulfate transport system permease protein|nr:sulfate ABC transporter permease subunit CysT [Lachnospiraceae bacterium]HEX3078690.1 sulfate ABC transporter permease subunit CysT [Lachnospiraceae bacterium]
MENKIFRLGKRKGKRVIPGFGLSLGVTLSMLSIIVLIPIASLVISASGLSPSEFLKVVTSDVVMAGYKVSFGCALIAAIINAIFGVILAWVLVRYEFPGKRFLDGFIELPFALPTAVAGIALTSLYSDEGWIGSILAKVGIKVAYTRTGIIIAMIFIGIPFVVRSIQPVLEKLDYQYEEAAAMLGASGRRTFFKVVFPEILPALLTGFGLALARGIGEYGSVMFIAGNIPYETQIAPLLIVSKLEQLKYEEATAIALVILAVSFSILLFINIIQAAARKRTNQ